MSRPPDWRLATKEDHKRVDSVLIGLASIAAVGAFSFQHLQPFTDPPTMFFGGLIIIFGLIAKLAMPVTDRAVWMIWWPIVMIFFGASILTVEGFRASDAAGWNDARCLGLQRAMLKPSKLTRSDIASVFEVMKCRPQGASPNDPNYTPPDPKFGPPPTKESIEAHRAFMDQQLANEVSVDGAR